MTDLALFPDLRPTLIYSSMNQTLADIPKQNLAFRHMDPKGCEISLKRGSYVTPLKNSCIQKHQKEIRDKVRTTMIEIDSVGEFS